ncbi:MAG: fasciclin domain-containing protein, partial [Ilumatobacter sp.]
TTTTTTTTTTTLAPPVVQEIGAFLQGRPDLSEAAALLDRVGLVEELEGAGRPFTIFVPTNDAIETLRNSASSPDFDDDDVVRALFEAHLVDGESLDVDAIAGRGSITVVNGGAQPVDASGTPVRVGGVSLTQIDNAVDGGIVHVVGGVLPVQP